MIELYEFQKKGVSFIKENINRGVLVADEMGLGKSIQVGFALRELYQENREKYCKTLILAPCAILLQWKMELLKCGFDEDVVVIFHRSSEKSIDLCLEKDIVITTNQTYMKTPSLAPGRFKTIVVDEAGIIKNQDTNITRYLEKNKYDHRIAISATPLQNDVDEIYSLFQFIDSELFDSKNEFDINFGKRISMGTRKRASECAKKEAIVAAATLQAMIKPYILRRKFGSVRNDITKNDNVLHVNLDEIHMNYYNLMSMGCGMDFRHDAKLRAVINENSPNYENKKNSTVIHLIKGFLRNEHKVTVFCKYMSSVSILKEILLKESISHGIISGKVSVKDRHERIENFNCGTMRVLILTTRSSAFGINLAAASKSIIYDSDFNPAVDNQAAARGFRLNSTQNVSVYRIIVSDTVEERVYMRQQEKNFTAYLVGVGGDDTEQSRHHKEYEFILDSPLFSCISHQKLRKRIQVNTEAILKRMVSERKERYARRNKNASVRLQLRKTLERNGGSMSTDQILISMRPFCVKYGVGAKNFKLILKKIAIRRNGKWYLRNKFN